jgi:hypothetical protein
VAAHRGNGGTQMLEYANLAAQSMRSLKPRRAKGL